MAKSKLTDLNFKWSPRGPAQQQARELWRRSRILFLIGRAGCGKTATSLGLALSEINKSTTSKLWLSRPMVFCEEQTGFLPGDLNAKLGAWLGPFYDVWGSLSEETDWTKFASALDKRLEIVPVGMMRGRTVRGVLCIDECQNLSAAQLKMVLTRIGDGGRIILTGDPEQSDIFRPNESPLMECAHRLEDLDTVSVVHFGPADQQRDELVNEIVNRL